MFHSPAFAKAMAGKPTPTRYSNFLKAVVISTISYLHIFTFAYSSSVALAKEDCAAYAAQVLDGSGIRIEFDSEERGFDCLMFLWLSGKGERRAFIVNISGEERQFEFKFTPNGETHSATLPPRSVKVCAE